MDNERFSRTEALIGVGALRSLSRSSVALFGVGGVGGVVAEALIRSGVGALTVFDGDDVDVSNFNRQIIADEKTVGRAKTDVIKSRLSAVNPDAKIEVRKVVYLPENADAFDFGGYDYVIDAVDTVTAKIEIIRRAKVAGVPVISCMGTGNKIEPTALRVVDISKTEGCPLARVMRRELKKRGIEGVKVVYSEEQPHVAVSALSGGKKKTVPSMIFVPAAAGLLIAKEVVFDLIEKGETEN